MSNKTISSIFKITADDYGYCAERNKGILESVERGLVNSVSVLINGSAVEKIEKRQNLAIGLHLNLTEGKPCSDLSEVTSLVDSEGMFYHKTKIIPKLEDGLLLTEEISIEITKQLDNFYGIFGFYPDYIDGHQHVHVMPGVLETLVEVMIDYKIFHTRVPLELGLNECKTVGETIYEKVDIYAKKSIDYLQKNCISFPRYFIGLTTMSKHFTIPNISAALDLVKKDVANRKSELLDDKSRLVEIMAHPGYPSLENVGGCIPNQPDNFSRSQDRKSELDLLTSSNLRSLLEKFISELMA